MAIQTKQNWINCLSCVDHINQSQIIPRSNDTLYYLRNKVGVVDFTKARGLVKFQSPRALRALGL